MKPLKTNTLERTMKYTFFLGVLLFSFSVQAKQEAKVWN